MSTTQSTPRATSLRQPMPSANRMSLGMIQTKGGSLPNRYIIHAVEGWGKTSLAAYFPRPVFIQSKGETGLQTLISANQLSETPYYPEAHVWEDILGCVQALIDEDHDYKTVAVDTMNGAERLCHEFVCHRDF